MKQVVFKEEIPTLQLSVQHGTADVPADGRYYVILQNEIIFCSESQRKAVRFYRGERERLFAIHGRPEPPHWDRQKWLEEERVKSDIRGMRSEWLQSFGAKVKKGGRGGRGGV